MREPVEAMIEGEVGEGREEKKVGGGNSRSDRVKMDVDLSGGML